MVLAIHLHQVAEPHGELNDPNCNSSFMEACTRDRHTPRNEEHHETVHPRRKVRFDDFEVELAGGGI